MFLKIYEIQVEHPKSYDYIQNLDNYTEFGFNISSIKIICGDCMESSDHNENIKKPLFIHDSEFISSYTKSKIKCSKCKKEDYKEKMENYNNLEFRCKECCLFKCELCLRKARFNIGYYIDNKFINRCINIKECSRFRK